MMDNRIFNVNGSTKEHLQKTLELAFGIVSDKCKCDGYFINPQYGMVLMRWLSDKDIPFPSPLTAESVTNIVWDWLKSNPQVEFKDWDANEDHDGSNSLGWRVYCENWGHVAGRSGTIVAVRPAFMWYGK